MFAACAPGLTGSVTARDPARDAGPGWLDLTQARVRGRGGSLEVAWTLAQRVPRRVPGPGLDLTLEVRTTDYTRYEIVAHHVGTKRMQTLVRFLGPGPGQGERAVRPGPRVDKATVTVRVPLHALSRLQTPFTWTATSYAAEPPASDGVPQVEGGARRRFVFPKGAKIPRRAPSPPRVTPTEPLHAEFKLVPQTASANEIWLRNGGRLEWRDCFVFLNDPDARGTGFGRTLTRLAPGQRAYLHRYSFLRDGTILPTTQPVDMVSVLCDTPRGWGLERHRVERGDEPPGSTAL
jgi:hypothetical protein